MASAGPRFNRFPDVSETASVSRFAPVTSHHTCAGRGKGIGYGTISEGSQPSFFLLPRDFSYVRVIKYTGATTGLAVIVDQPLRAAGR